MRIKMNLISYLIVVDDEMIDESENLKKDTK